MTIQKPRGDMQSRILAYIEQEIKTRGYAPSVREIGEAVGLKSTSTVHGHLMRLEKKGLLHRDAMKPRALPYPHLKTYPFEKSRLSAVWLLEHPFWPKKTSRKTYFCRKNWSAAGMCSFCASAAKA